MITLDEAIHHLRSDPQYANLMHDSYISGDISESCRHFQNSAEFSEVLKIIGSYVDGGKIMDLGAGNGIASQAFSKFGAKIVFALEPNPSDEIGYGAIRRMPADPTIKLIAAIGEDIPLPDGEVDVVYARQVLHHTQNLFIVLRECFRVLKRGGVFLACREHVVDDKAQLAEFLRKHPVHQLAGGENAFQLSQYKEAIISAGFKLARTLGPWDSIINAFPAVRSSEELEVLPRVMLKRRFGCIGYLASYLPGVVPMVRSYLRNLSSPGRLYTFVAYKL